MCHSACSPKDIANLKTELEKRAKEETDAGSTSAAAVTEAVTENAAAEAQVVPSTPTVSVEAKS